MVNHFGSMPPVHKFGTWQSPAHSNSAVDDEVKHIQKDALSNVINVG